MRMGASMMAPDYTHWDGAVEVNLTIAEMISDLEIRKKLKELEKK
jgi:hypothetical protein